MNHKIGYSALVLFVGTVWLANWLVSRYGPVSVGFGLTAPAGVYAVGLAFTLRDIVHRFLGRTAVVAAILLGCLLAYFIEAGNTIPGGLVSIAVASAIAFLLSELLDLSAYEPLAERSFPAAVAVSNTVGIVIDSALFLWLAFGELGFFWGQVVGKAWMTLLALPLVIVSRRILTPEQEAVA